MMILRNMQWLRSKIKDIIKEEKGLKGNAILSGSIGDIEQCLLWLNLNGVLKNAKGPKKRNDGKYSVVINFKGKKDKLIDLIRNRFGSFVLIEGPRGGFGLRTGMPFTQRSPGFGFGAQTSNHKMVSKTPFGGNVLEPNPIKPYSDDFSKEIQSQRENEFFAKKHQLINSIENLKKNLTLSKGFDRVYDEITFFFKKPIDFNQILGDQQSSIEHLFRNNEVQKALSIVFNNIDIWLKEKVCSAQAMGFDVSQLDGFENNDFDLSKSNNHSRLA